MFLEDDYVLPHSERIISVIFGKNCSRFGSRMWCLRSHENVPTPYSTNIVVDAGYWTMPHALLLAVKMAVLLVQIQLPKQIISLVVA